MTKSSGDTYCFFKKSINENNKIILSRLQLLYVLFTYNITVFKKIPVISYKINVDFRI
jgi:hypothetical protein